MSKKYENSGFLMKNQRKNSENHPDMTGKINVAGTEYRIAGWNQKSNKGNKYLSLAVSEWKENPNNRDSQRDDEDDGVPF